MLIRQKTFNFFKRISSKGRVLTGKKRILAFILIFIVSLVSFSEIRQNVLAQTTITLAELQTHNTPSNCWMVIAENGINKVYNVSGHNALESGHMTAKYITNYCGKDGTNQYNKYGHGASRRAMLNNLPGIYKGILADIVPPPTTDTQPPTVSITCPSNGATYTSPVTTVSGTAADNVGVKEVWVKVGPSGTWQLAATTNSWATWVISNLTGIVPGANTIYAKSIDTSNNTSLLPSGESGVFINVTISASSAPAPAPGASATIAYLGDAHMDRGTTNSIAELTKDFNVIKTQSPTGTVDAIFMSGDMESVNSVYKAYQASSANGIPIYFAPGNHDVSPNTVSDVKTKSWLFTTYPMHQGPGGTEKSTYSVDVGNTHVIVVNEYWDEGTNEAWFKYGGSEGAYIGPKLMSWIEADLKSTSTQYKVVVLHEPLYPSDRHIGDSLDKNKANRDAFQKILNDNGVDVVVAGHTHYSSTVKQENILHVIDGVPGAKAGNNADPWASIWYTNVAADGCLNITWKHENSNNWASPTVKTYTSACSGSSGGGNPPPTCTAGSGPGPGPVDPTPTCTDPCDDNNACTSGDACSGGVCRGTLKECADTGTDSECTFDACDPATGACTHTDTCGGLVPCGRLVDNPKTGQINEQAPCDLCSTFYMIKGVINYVVEIVFSLAVLALIIAGILYAASTGDQHLVDLARSTVYYAVVGLFIVFLAWILIAAILQGIGYGKMSSWNQVDCILVAK